MVPTYDAVGYAKTPKALIDFAHSVAGQTGVILDPLYTAPMLWHLIKKRKENTWNFGNRFLMIHTGGLSVNKRNQSAFSTTRQFAALAMLMFLASCGSKKQVYYADAAMNEQTITAKGKK